MSGTESDDPDLLAIEVDGKRLTGWKTASVTRTIEGFPSSFLLTAADPYPATPTAIPVVPGAEVTLKAGEDLLVTGYIDRVNLTYSSPVQHDIAIQGRGRGQDLVDCSADLTDAQLVGGQVSAASFAQLAERLCRPHGIKTRLVGSDPGPVIPSFAVALGETPYEVIDRVARYARFICWEDAEGRLVLDKIGTEEMASGLVQGVNIESATVMFGIDQRFSQYLVVYNPLARFAELGDAANQRAFAKDPTMPRYRPRIIVSPQLSPEFDIGKALGGMGTGTQDRTLAGGIRDGARLARLGWQAVGSQSPGRGEYSRAQGGRQKVADRSRDLSQVAPGHADRSHGDAARRIPSCADADAAVRLAGAAGSQ